MFQLIYRRTGTPETVFGVHKSGPSHEHTKFLVHLGGWRWLLAAEFEPAPEGAHAYELCNALP